MSSVVLAGDTSGSVTLASPAVAGTTVVTLPAVSGTVALAADAYTDTNALTLLNASGTAPVYACRAWVNFNGTGTVAIRGSGNVSSITDNGVGNYTVNFTTAMVDANYSITASLGFLGSTVSSNSCAMVKDNVAIPSTTSFTVSTTLASNGASLDVERIFVSIFR
jgi:hypothetical protein